MTTRAKAEELIALGKKATPGPWKPGRGSDYGAGVWCQGMQVCKTGHAKFDLDNADFIAAARNDGPEVAQALVEAMKRLRSKQRASCREWCKCEDCLMVTEFFGEQWYDSGEGR